MPSFAVQTPGRSYPILVERGCLASVGELIPKRAGKVFCVTTEDVWRLHGSRISPAFEVLFLPDGESHKRLAEVEALAERMVQKGADRSSVVVGFGGGVVTDVAGFLAAIFMRGI